MGEGLCRKFPYGIEINQTLAGLIRRARLYWRFVVGLLLGLLQSGLLGSNRGVVVGAVDDAH